MISKQASTLPRRLLRRYGTSVPFELADCLGITILECHDFKLQKGAFKVILNNCFIFINAKGVAADLWHLPQVYCPGGHRGLQYR